MIAVSREYPSQQPSTPAWHAGFIAILPQVRNHLRFGFRRLPSGERAEAMAEAVANVAFSYARLHERGKANVAFATSLADYAIRHYFAGRRIGNQLNANDITSPYAQRKRGFVVKSLDQRDPAGEWKEIVVEDGRVTPAEVAASRIDIDDWLNQLPRLKRNIAETLAKGETTSATARRFDVTPGRVSQVRRELEDDWPSFSVNRWSALEAIGPILSRSFGSQTSRFSLEFLSMIRSFWAALRDHLARGLPDNAYRIVLAVVEGKHDVEFLRRVSRILHGANASLPDLTEMEQAGRLSFIPFGGGDIMAWANRLAGLHQAEFHLYDREKRPETGVRQQAARIVNARPRCRAFVTKKRALENYLASSAIYETRGLDVQFSDDDDVADLVAHKTWSTALSEPPWESLSARARKRLRERAKRWLNSQAADRMTAPRID